MVENLAYNYVKQFFGCNFTMDKVFSYVQNKEHPYAKMIDSTGETKVIIHNY